MKKEVKRKHRSEPNMQENQEKATAEKIEEHKKIETLREKATKWTCVEAKIEAFSENKTHENHINKDKGKNGSFFLEKNVKKRAISDLV